jgi:hypothetical protein
VTPPWVTAATGLGVLGRSARKASKGWRPVPVRAFPQPGVDLNRKPGDRCDAVGGLKRAPHGAAVQGADPLVAQPLADMDGLLPADLRQPGITRQAFLLRVLDQVGHRHTTILPA